MGWKRAGRKVLHQMGGLAALRLLRRAKFRVLMFHEFRDAHRAQLQAICEHIARKYEPLPLSTLIAAMNRQVKLPPNAVAVTVDDAYRNYLLHGHSIFRRHRIPTTIYAVAGFSDGQLWLWADQVAFAIQNTGKRAIRAEIVEGQTLDLDLSTCAAKDHAVAQLWEALKLCPNQRRLEFMDRLGALCGVEIPPVPPEDRAALNWDELRALSAEEVEIGCHTYTHPILSRVTDRADLDREIQGAKALMEARLKLEVTHFCYPNGRDIDIGAATVAGVQAAGFSSSVTCTYGLNTLEANPLLISRMPFDSGTGFEYAAELLAGLHL